MPGPVNIRPLTREGQRRKPVFYAIVGAAGGEVARIRRSKLHGQYVWRLREAGADACYSSSRGSA